MAYIKQINVGGTAYDIKAAADASGNIIADTYVKKSGDTMSGNLHVANTANNTAGLAINIQTQSYSFGLHMGTGGTNHGFYDWTTSEGWMICRTGNNNAIWTGFHGNTSSAVIRNIGYGTTAPNNSDGSNGDVYLLYI